MTEEQENEGHDRRRGYAWYSGVVPGVYVLVVGILFLLNNFGYFQGDAWGKLWPLFIIIPALLMIFRPRKW